MPILIPDAPVEATKLFTAQKFATLGPAGIGKSHLWAVDPLNIIVDMEGNINHLKCRKVVARSWDDLKELYVTLLQQKLDKKPFSFQAISFDTLDRLIDFAHEDVIAEARVKFKGAVDKGLQINVIGDVPEGIGWDMRQTKVMNLLNKFHELGVAVNLVGHTQDKQIETPTRKYSKNTINFGGQLGSKILGWTNHTLNVEANWVGARLERKVHTLPSDAWEAKSHGGVIPDGWKWDDDMEKNWKYLKGLFN